MNNHKAAIFDMDGVIIDSGPIHMEAWKRTLDKRGLVFEEEKFRRAFGMRDSEVIPHLIGLMSDEETQELCNNKSQVFQEIVRTQGIAIEGLSDFLDHLAEQKVEIGLASLASEEEIATVLKVLGLTDRLPVLISRENEMRDKPAPDIFLTAVYRLGYQPQEAVVFEDAVSGIEAARSAGTTVVALTTSYSPGELSHADLVVENFRNDSLVQLFI